MKKLVILFACVVVLQFGATDAAALSYTFSGIDEGGTGSATMDIDVAGALLTITLDNTSPVLLNDETGPNSPGIVAFGFNVTNNPLPTVTDWSLTALMSESDSIGGYTSSLVTLGGAPAAGLDIWEILIDDKLEGVELDYFAANQNGATNVDGGLFNPDIIGQPDNIPGGNNEAYYTTAILMMTFSADLTSVITPYIRMQVVGLDGEGSLKLWGEEENGGGGGGDIPIPEPTTMLLLGSGLVAIGIKGRKKAQK